MAGVSLHGHGCPEPIGLEYLAGTLVRSGFTCSFQSRNELRAGWPGKRWGLSLLSAITSEYSMVLRAAREAKERGNITVVGGYHACGGQDDFTNGPFDYVVVGEGEEVATAIAKAHLLGDWGDLNRFEIRKIGPARVVRASRITNLDALPLPLRSEDRLAYYRVYDLMWPPPSRQRNAALVLSSRGCVNDCSFCGSSSVWGCGVTLRSTELVVEELRDLKTRFGSNTVVFIDQSLGQATRWTLDLCEAIKSTDLRVNWYHQSNLTVDKGVIRTMADAGCTKIGFGLEGISPRAVSRIKPVNTCNIEEVNSLFNYCNSLGLFVKVYLMLGFPWETLETIKEYFDWLPKIRANQIKISYFTPFPGTRDWDRHKDHLVTSNWADFDTVTLPVVHNPSISIAEYHKIRKRLFRTFYGSSTYANVTRQMLCWFPHYAGSYQEFADYLQHFDMISGDETWLEWIRGGQAVHVLLAAAR